MFISDKDLSFEILSVLNLRWSENNGKALNRPFHALSFRINGNAEFVYSDGSTSIKSKETVFVPKFFDYTLKSMEEELIVVHLTCTDELPREIKKFKAKDPQYYERKFKEMYSVWIKQQTGYKYECKSILYKILTAIEKEMANDLSPSDAKISDAVEFIHENFMNGEISVAELAAMCNMSDTYFRRIFVEKYLVTPTKYINALKLHYAKEMLKSGYYSVQEVSDRCGFNTVSYFSSFIKKETGFSPSELYKKIY